MLLNKSTFINGEVLNIILKEVCTTYKALTNMFIFQVNQPKSMRVTRRIVLTLLTKALYKFGCFKERVWSFLWLWIWQRCYFTELPWDDFVWPLPPFISVVFCCIYVILWFANLTKFRILKYEYLLLFTFSSSKPV